MQISAKMKSRGTFLYSIRLTISFKGVLRFINHSKGTHEVSIVGYDDEGTEYGPATFVLGSQDNELIYASELENGDRLIEDGLGRGNR